VSVLSIKGKRKRRIKKAKTFWNEYLRRLFCPLLVILKVCGVKHEVQLWIVDRYKNIDFIMKDG
jgi:hypothetical protein